MTDPNDELGDAPNGEPDEPEPVPDVATDTVVDDPSADSDPATGNVPTDITIEPGETVTITAPHDEEGNP